MIATTDATAALRRSLYLTVAMLSLGIVAAKIIGAENLFEPSRYKPPTAAGYTGYLEPGAVPKRVWPAVRPEPTPMLSSNDRSRFATIRVLVEQGTYAIGKRENFRSDKGFVDTGVIFQDGYQSLDKVMDPETGVFYSSKPPLFPTVLAGVYFILNRVFGLEMDRDRWWVVSILLLIVNLLPFAAYLWLLAKLSEQHFSGDFGKLFTYTFAATATFLTTFSTTLNNHLPACCCVLFALYPLLRREQSGPLGLFLSGFFSGVAATLELPALSLTAALFVHQLRTRNLKAWPFLIGALIPALAFFGSNYASIGKWLPAYGEFGGPWYDFPGSNWVKLKDPMLRPTLGIDGAEEPKWLYAFHLTFGHHGWFSLTPVWLVAGCGLMAQAARALRLRAAAKPVEQLAIMTLLVSIVVFAFYVMKSNNYGGFTSCARWLMWLTPLWLFGLPDAAERLNRTTAGRAFLVMLLFASAFAVYYPSWNPWRPPWILQLCELVGWVRYY